MMSKLDRLMMLQEEVKIAKFVEEMTLEDMGYVNTAISYMKERILDLRLEINKKLDA